MADKRTLRLNRYMYHHRHHHRSAARWTNYRARVPQAMDSRVVGQTSGLYQPTALTIQQSDSTTTNIIIIFLTIVGILNIPKYCWSS